VARLAPIWTGDGLQISGNCRDSPEAARAAVRL
jgi:hypothetical protein